MEVVFVILFDVLPAGSAKLGWPVGRQLAVYAFFPDVVVLVFFLTGEGFFKPFVFGGRVVEHHVEHNADSAFVCFFDELLEVFHCAVVGVDGGVVCNIIAVVFLRRRVDRVQPYVGDAEFF